MTYTVKVTKQAYGQMREIMSYITNELFVPEAAQNLLDKFQKAISELNEAYKKRDGDKYIEFKAFNVGCMHWNYTPVTLKQILEKQKENNKNR